jgi:glucosamine--fructose-6-phosphate aminotransferase (isomerizing)
VPTVAVVPADDLWDKNLASIAEIRARRGPVLVVTDAAADVEVPGATAVLRVPQTEPELAPLLLGVPLQLLAYHAAVILGRDVDMPRNLAKSVTVE